MNEEELRAFLNSATIGEDDGATIHEDDDAESLAKDVTSALQVDGGPSPVVPSFDELMRMSDPDQVPEPTASVREAPSVPPTAATSAEPAEPIVEAVEPVAEPAEPVATAESSPINSADEAVAPEQNVAAAQEGKAQAHAEAQDGEQLVPLILPGFSSSPRPTRDLPPVFQADLAAPKEPGTMHIDPVPTQPFDVLSDSHVGESTDASPAQGGGLAAAAAAATVGAAATVAPAAGAVTPTPFGAAAASSAESVVTTPVSPEPTASGSGLGATQQVENPFAILAPDLVASDSGSDSTKDNRKRVSDTGGASRERKALPWLIVGAGVVVAIIASIFVINGVRGNDVPAPTDKPAVTAKPAPSQTTPPAPAPEPSAEPVPEPTVAPVVDPGSTWTLPIEQWSMNVEVSEKLGGSTPYTLFDGNTRVMFDSLPVASGLSDACAAARAEHAWGLLKKEDGKLEVIRPEPRCTNPSDAAVYDTIWGVMDHMAKSAKPA